MNAERVAQLQRIVAHQSREGEELRLLRAVLEFANRVELDTCSIERVFAKPADDWRVLVWNGNTHKWRVAARGTIHACLTYVEQMTRRPR